MTALITQPGHPLNNRAGREPAFSRLHWHLKKGIAVLLLAAAIPACHREPRYSVLVHNGQRFTAEGRITEEAHSYRFRAPGGGEMRVPSQGTLVFPATRTAIESKKVARGF